MSLERARPTVPAGSRTAARLQAPEACLTAFQAWCPPVQQPRGSSPPPPAADPTHAPTDSACSSRHSGTGAPSCHACAGPSRRCPAAAALLRASCLQPANSSSQQGWEGGGRECARRPRAHPQDCNGVPSWCSTAPSGSAETLSGTTAHTMHLCSTAGLSTARGGPNGTGWGLADATDTEDTLATLGTGAITDFQGTLAR